MGRKKLPSELKRNIILTVRVNQKELAELRNVLKGKRSKAIREAFKKAQV